MTAKCAGDPATDGVGPQDGAAPPSLAAALRPRQNWSGAAPQNNQQRQPPRTRQEDDL